VIVALYFVLGSMAFSRKIKLGDCRSPSPTFEFSCPRGTDYEIVLGAVTFTGPEVQSSYQGKLQVTDDGGKQLLFSDFSGEQNRDFEWVDKNKIGGFLLTRSGSKEVPSLTRALTPGTHYKIIVNFSTPPSEGTSIWLRWHQNLLGF
jgi:hypothetical protein